LAGLANSSAQMDLVSAEIERLLDCQMPLSSSELTHGDRKYAQFQKVFAALMEVIRSCRNGDLVVQLVRDHLFVDRNHIFMEEIMQSLNDFIGSLDLVQSRRISEQIIGSVDQSSHAKDPASLRIQRMIIDKIGVCVIVRLAEIDCANARDLFASNCCFLLNSIQTCSLENLADITRTICALNLMMTFYRALDYNEDIKTYVHDGFKTLDTVSRPDADKSMHYTQLVMRTLMKVRKEPKYLEPPLLSNCPADLREDALSIIRELHQTVQSVFITVVRRTQEKSNFVDLVLKDCAWEQIVDTKATIKMEVHSNFRKNFNVLSDFRARRGLRSQMQSKQSSNAGFTDSYASLGNLTLEVGDLSSLYGITSKEPASEGGASRCNIFSQEDVILDSDEVNDNPVMTHLMLLFDRIRDKAFHKNDQGTVPPWVNELRNAIDDSKQESKRKISMNARLFVAKVLINGTNRHPDILLPYAREFFHAFFNKESGLALWLTKQGFTLSKIPGSFNNYLREVCILWSSWMYPPSPDDVGFNLHSPSEVELGWNFLHSLMKISPHEETAVAKSNVQFLQLFIQKWRGKARMEDLLTSMKLIRSYLTLSVSKQEESNMDACKRVEVCNSTGIQLLNLFLVQEMNEIENKATSQPFTRIDFIDLCSLFELVLGKFVVPSSSVNKENRKFRAKRLLKPASQVCGLALACMESLPLSAGEREQYDKLKETLRVKIRDLKSANQLDQALFAASAAVQSNPALALFYDQMALESVIKLHGDFQCMALGILIEYLYWLCKNFYSKSSDSMDLDEERMSANRLWSDIGRNFARFVEKQDEKLQILVLRLLSGRDEDGKRRCLDQQARKNEGLLAFLKVPDFFAKDPDFLQLRKSDSTVFRSHRSELCRFHFYLVLMDLHEIWPSDSSTQGLPSVDRLRHYLIAGLSDPSERIQASVLQWWHSRGVSENPCFRLLDLLERTRSEDGLNFHWASSSAWLLLSACKQVNEEMLFDRPLQDQKFRNLKISTNYSAGGTSMAPMFANSLQLFTQRASQTFRFSSSLGSTFQDGVLGTQVLDDISQGDAVDASLYVQNQTQLPDNDLFISRRPGGAISGIRPESTLKKPMRPRVTATQDDSSAQKIRFARRHEDLVALKKKVKIERANRVELLRKYRAGMVLPLFFPCNLKYRIDIFLVNFQARCLISR
jgi:hypothetical protein